MSGSLWRPLNGLDRGKLNEARLQAHYAAQWLARAARAYIAPQDNDGHTNLGWDDKEAVFATHPLPDGSRFSLTITSVRSAIRNVNREPSGNGCVAKTASLSSQPRLVWPSLSCGGM